MVQLYILPGVVYAGSTDLLYILPCAHRWHLSIHARSSRNADAGTCSVHLALLHLQHLFRACPRERSLSVEKSSCITQVRHSLRLSCVHPVSFSATE